MSIDAVVVGFTVLLVSSGGGLRLRLSATLHILHDQHSLSFLTGASFIIETRISLPAYLSLPAHHAQLALFTPALHSKRHKHSNVAAPPGEYQMRLRPAAGRPLPSGDGGRYFQPGELP